MFGHRTSIFVREHVAVLKLRDTYDLIDPETGTLLGMVKDEPAPWAKWLRLLVEKTYLPTMLNVYQDGCPRPILRVRKHAGFLRTRLEIQDDQGRRLAQLRNKVFSLGGAFRIFEPSGREIGQLKGDWKGWDYSATIQERSIGIVTKKWSGLLKEAFTNADQYLVQAERPEQLALLLGLALAVDLVYKDRQR